MVTQTIQPVRGMAMTELVQARGRVDAQTVADARRTPAVPITRFSYDRRAMQEARLARGRIGAPTPTPTPPAAAAEGTPVGDSADSPAEVGADAEEDDMRPLLVVPCIAEYPDTSTARRSDHATAAAARASAVARAAADQSEDHALGASPTGARRPVDHVAARAEATAADARLRTAALAARADQLRARLGGATIDLRDEAAATAASGRSGAPKRRRLVRA